MSSSAKAANVSKSKWISDVIREKLATDWPSSVQELAGAWQDFPTIEELRSDTGIDAKREQI